MTYFIRRAKPFDAGELTTLALLSKAYWGYPKEWLDLWRDELEISPKIIEQSIAFVVIYHGKIVGFWCRSFIESRYRTPGYLFIHPEHMRKGIARRLWLVVKKEAIAKGIKAFTIEADPHAVPFYLEIGGQKIGEIESQVIPGRKIPLIKFILSDEKRS
jgi:GNAT superfamily N-acetyltransferase